jgi:hypothetical protein
MDDPVKNPWDGLSSDGQAIGARGIKEGFFKLIISSKFNLINEKNINVFAKHRNRVDTAIH